MIFYIYSDRSICICCLITYTLILLFFLSQVLRCVSVFSFQLCAQVLSSVFICFQYSTPELLEPVCFVTTDCIVAMTSCENNTEYLRYWVTKLRQKYKYIVMQYRGEQCNAMPSFWKRQARHTHTSNPQIHWKREKKRGVLSFEAFSLFSSECDSIILTAPEG